MHKTTQNLGELERKKVWSLLWWWWWTSMQWKFTILVKICVYSWNIRKRIIWMKIISYKFVGVLCPFVSSWIELGWWYSGGVTGITRLRYFCYFSPCASTDPWKTLGRVGTAAAPTTTFSTDITTTTVNKLMMIDRFFPGAWWLLLNISSLSVICGIYGM